MTACTTILSRAHGDGLRFLACAPGFLGFSGARGVEVLEAAACRAQKLNLHHFPKAGRREKLPIELLDSGGLVDALGGAGDGGILPAKGVIGGRKSLPSTATIGSATKASPAAIAGQGSSLLDPGVSMVSALAKAAFDRDTRNGAGMTP